LSSPPYRLTYIGHSTILIEMDGMRILTDPVLRDRVAHLSRRGPSPDLSRLAAPDAVLLSHLHRDHCDVPSLRLLGRDTRLFVPSGGGPMLRRRGFRSVEELAVGEMARVGPLSIRAVPATHGGFRPPLGPAADAVGFMLEGDRRVYFAGDTDLFPEMAGLAVASDGRRLDIALLPVWGYGPTLGPGHLDPWRAAQALRLLRPAVAIPIHWGSFRPPRLPGLSGSSAAPRFLTQPPYRFASYAAELAPDVAVRVVPPGEVLTLIE
jgi:L-ascorbate metabolism protein UlaG (beta-lactamase superfamily)